MTRYQVIWSDNAKAYLAGIHIYLTRKVSQVRANDVQRGILQRVDTLIYFPYAFPAARRKNSLGQDLRTLSKWSYVIHYLVDDEQKIVAIDSVEHAHQDT